jgi:hypothetical protein
VVQAEEVHVAGGANRLYSRDDNDDMFKLGGKTLFVLSSLQVSLEFISYEFTVHFLHALHLGIACAVQGLGRCTNLILTPSKKPRVVTGVGYFLRIQKSGSVQVTPSLLDAGLDHFPTKVHLMSSTGQMGSWGLVEVHSRTISVWEALISAHSHQSLFS